MNIPKDKKNRCLFNIKLNDIILNSRNPNNRGFQSKIDRNFATKTLLKLPLSRAPAGVYSQDFHLAQSNQLIKFSLRKPPKENFLHSLNFPLGIERERAFVQPVKSLPFVQLRICIRKFSNIFLIILRDPLSAIHITCILLSLECKYRINGKSFFFFFLSLFSSQKSTFSHIGKTFS